MPVLLSFFVKLLNQGRRAIEALEARASLDSIV